MIPGYANPPCSLSLDIQYSTGKNFTDLRNTLKLLSHFFKLHTLQLRLTRPHLVKGHLNRSNVFLNQKKQSNYFITALAQITPLFNELVIYTKSCITKSQACNSVSTISHSSTLTT